mmetsp:Transcript_46833/g.118002  ORF Transcript_46833/g.118002 Transcript_46833/m.118002 type:complete len:592 (+) Transcript_46833:101-1876(+)
MRSLRSPLLAAAQLFGHVVAAVVTSGGGGGGERLSDLAVVTSTSEPRCFVGGGCDADESAYLQVQPGAHKKHRAGHLAAIEEGYPMCAKAAEVCNYLGNTSTGSLLYVAVREALHSGGALEAFLAQMGIEFGEDVMLDCTQVCQAAVDHLTKSNVVMPSAPDLGCYPTNPSDLDGSVVCDFDLSPAALLSIFADHPIELPQPDQPRKSVSAIQQMQGSMASEAHEVVDMLHDLQGRLSTKVGWNPYVSSTYGFQRTVDEHTNNVALRLLYIFRVYPKAWITYIPQDGLGVIPEGHKEPWPTLVAKNNLVSRAYLNAVIMMLMVPDASAKSMTTWFGESAATNPLIRVEVARTLSGITELVNNAVVTYSPHNPECFQGAYAYVAPYGLRGVPNPLYQTDWGENGISESPRGTKVINFCDFYFAYPQRPSTFSHGLWESVQTFIHEASHHGPAFTTDVSVCHETVYANIKTSSLELVKFMQVAAGAQLQLVSSGQVWLQFANASVSGSLDNISAEGQYVGTVIRFSEDGDYALMELMPTDAPESCNELAYGQQACKDLAKTQPFKALLNADSFGYFIVEMAEHFFAKEAQELP